MSEYNFITAATDAVKKAFIEGFHEGASAMVDSMYEHEMIDEETYHAIVGELIKKEVKK